MGKLNYNSPYNSIDIEEKKIIPGKNINNEQFGIILVGITISIYIFFSQNIGIPIKIIAIFILFIMTLILTKRYNPAYGGMHLKGKTIFRFLLIYVLKKIKNNRSFNLGGDSQYFYKNKYTTKGVKEIYNKMKK